jgi:formate dehydrogenase major subunit
MMRAKNGLRDGEQVRVVSRYGSAVLPVRVDEAMLRGQLFATFHTPDVRNQCADRPAP